MAEGLRDTLVIIEEEEEEEEEEFIFHKQKYR